MNFGLPDLFFYLLNLVVVFVALRFFVYKPVTKFLKKREDDISALMRQTKDAREHAEAAQRMLEERMQQTQSETSQILAEASRSAAARADDIIAEALKEAADAKTRARRDIETEKRHAQRMLKVEITDMALTLAQKVIRRELSAEDNKQLIEDFFKEVV